MWVMGFKNDLDIEAVAQYLESCLDMKTFHQTRNADFGNSHYIDWESADEKYSIGLQYSDKMLLNDKSAPIGAAFFSGYILKVTVWKK